MHPVCKETPPPHQGKNANKCSETGWKHMILDIWVLIKHYSIEFFHLPKNISTMQTAFKHDLLVFIFILNLPAQITDYRLLVNFACQCTFSLCMQVLLCHKQVNSRFEIAFQVIIDQNSSTWNHTNLRKDNGCIPTWPHTNNTIENVWGHVL